MGFLSCPIQESFPQRKNCRRNLLDVRAEPILNHDPSSSKRNVYAWFRRHFYSFCVWFYTFFISIEAKKFLGKAEQ